MQHKIAQKKKNRTICRRYGAQDSSVGVHPQGLLHYRRPAVEHSPSPRTPLSRSSAGRLTLHGVCVRLQNAANALVFFIYRRPKGGRFWYRAL